MTPYRLGILAMYLSEQRLEELSYFRKLSTYGHKLGIQILVFTPDDVDKNKKKIKALVYDVASGKWQRKWALLPELIYDRCRYHGVHNFHKISRFRAVHKKLHYLSSPLANKWSMHQALSEDSVIADHLPATVRYNDHQDMIRLLKQHQRIYLKPRNGTGGRGIVRLQRISNSTFLMQGRDEQRRIIPQQKISESQISTKLSSWRLQGRYIVQQGISLTLKDGRVHDFRMLIQKDGKGEWQVTGCAGRIGPMHSVTSNLHGGGTAIAMEKLLMRRFGNKEKVASIQQEAYKLGIDIAHFLERKFGKQCEIGIDLAIDPKGKVWLLEVNPKPSREVFYRIGERETYRKAITRPLEYALWLHHNKNKNKIPEEQD
ncbi:YheC/YheD family protein [Paenibacillus sp. FSL H7-0331]|uniref:YheC/YheD family endospore coat-associated protein n=1 Tax=Paenibacillus sp. FSL H7-0331 TaxID=1920421 RepID=UPI00096D5A43|nr:YheC/YheD family protein [Paenibacillus sp. FSL H7-0331]OMF14082.1 endospore coat-associated protein [Paenibacillus sp. FSL H7-0331]